jgi:hypothetical protein
MEAEQQPQTQASPPTSPRKDPFALFGKIAAALIIAVLLIGGGIYLGTYMNRPGAEQQPVPSPVPTVRETVSNVSPTSVLQEEKKLAYTSKKMADLSFPSFTVNYPETWTKAEKSDQLTQEVAFSKDGYQIRIWQGPTGGNACIFEGTMPEGPANDYRGKAFVEIKAGNLTFRRIGEGSAYSLCQESTADKGFYFLPTSIGGIDYKLPAQPDQEILLEMDGIISTVKTN